MEISFRAWFENVDLTQHTDDLLKAGSRYEGDSYLPGGENEELAAAVQGKKRVALIRAVAAAGHPAFLAFNTGKPVSDAARNVSIIQKMLLSQGVRYNEFTILPLKGTLTGWIAAGREERDVRELARLLKLQEELCVTSSMCSPAEMSKLLNALRHGENTFKIMPDKMGDMGQRMGILHQKIGELLGYKNDLLMKPGPYDPSFDPNKKYVGEVPFSLRNREGGTWGAGPTRPTRHRTLTK
jgi:hypothetical protein